MDLAVGRRLVKEELRQRLESGGFSIRELSVGEANEKSGETSVLCGDSSTATRELRYHALWGVHSVCVHGVFDGLRHDDLVVGQGSVFYRDLMYSSDVEFGSLIPYSDVDSRTNSLRVHYELSSTLKCLKEFSAGVDYVLLDGSIHTNLKNLNAKRGGYAEDSRALKVLQECMKIENLVGMVEDSHATDLAGDLGFDFTNMLLFEVALNPLEYVVDLREGTGICYLKLPPKKLAHLPSGVSSPLTARWEFNKKDFEDDLRRLAFMWLLEDDILHPQLYPLRLADYLTRRIKVGGLLDRLVQEKGLELRHRELREG